MVRRKPKTYCDDWSCPSMWTCARAWGRAEEYWTFDQEDFDAGRVETRRFDRRPGVDSCDDYQRDVPRAWLKDVFTSQVPMEPPMRGYRLHLVQPGGRA